MVPGKKRPRRPGDGQQQFITSTGAKRDEMPPVHPDEATTLATRSRLSSKSVAELRRKLAQRQELLAALKARIMAQLSQLQREEAQIEHLMQTRSTGSASMEARFWDLGGAGLAPATQD